MTTITTPLSQPLALVSVTTDPRRAEPCLESWLATATTRWPLALVEHGVVAGTPLTTVRGFNDGVERALRFKPHADLIACISDALVILEANWDLRVCEAFAADPSVGLVSFDGLTALEVEGDRLVPLAPAHGLPPGPIVAPCDWAVVGRRSFWTGFAMDEVRTGFTRRQQFPRPWAVLDDHHLAEWGLGEALGCLAKRGGWGVQCVPIRHRRVPKPVTAYERWAEDQIEGGDRGFSQAAHRILLDTFSDVLPLRLTPERVDERG